MMIRISYCCAALALAVSAVGCSSSDSENPKGDAPPSSSDPSPGEGVPAFPFEALAPVAYTTKVKNLLTGLAVNDHEVQMVNGDPTALRGLIEQWMSTPEFRVKVLDFFKQAFQQTQLNIMQFDDLLGNKTAYLHPAIKARIVQSTELSFPLTALQLVEEGRPFTDVLTTDRYMLNPPLMSLLGYVDNFVFDDNAEMSSWLMQKFGDKFKMTVHYDDSLEIPLEESADPESPNFLHFAEACPIENGGPSCKVVVTAAADRVPQNIWNVVFGRYAAGPGMVRTAGAVGMAVANRPALFTDADWDDWRMIRVRRPQLGELPTLFWDLPTFRNKQRTELLLNTERVGFMTTLAFFANWPTNLSNLARATVNQALIVGLGYSLADTNAIIPVSETGNPDSQHSQPGTACYACHQTLDPMRNFFRQSFSVTYHRQTLPLPPEQQQAKFMLDGVESSGSGVRDFAQAMAQHPRFAGAWAQKLCQFANSASCDEDDPEFLRVASVFRDSGFSFKVLVRELFSSPLVTLAAPTETSGEVGAVVSVSRRDHLCAALQSRLGLTDACDLSAVEPSAIQNLAFGIPGAGYTRGASSPLLPREPNLFFCASVEGLCGRLADRVIDRQGCPAGRVCFRSADPERALDDMVRAVMALPESDPRYADVRQIVGGHYAEATSAGYGVADALRSAFVLACTSPLSSTIGL